ncbi:MAG: hypothetical protein AAGH15_18865 [Myxococcota bacterium]
MRKVLALVLLVACGGDPAAVVEDLGVDGPCFMCEMGAGTPPDAGPAFVPVAARMTLPPCSAEAPEHGRFVVADAEFSCGEEPARYFELEPLGELDDGTYAVEASTLRARFCEAGSCERVLAGTLRLRRVYTESPRIEIAITRLDGVAVSALLDAEPACFTTCDDAGRADLAPSCGMGGEEELVGRVDASLSCGGEEAALRFTHPDTLFVEGGVFAVGAAGLRHERCAGEVCSPAIDGFLRYESLPETLRDAAFHWLVRYADGSFGAGREVVDAACEGPRPCP